jgi:hypothetical protein
VTLCSLTDTQLVLLSAAAQREDGGIELVPNVKGGAAHKVAGKLLTQGLIEEIPARGALPIWHRDETNGLFALRKNFYEFCGSPVSAWLEYEPPSHPPSRRPLSVVLMSRRSSSTSKAPMEPSSR